MNEYSAKKPTEMINSFNLQKICLKTDSVFHTGFCEYSILNRNRN